MKHPDEAVKIMGLLRYLVIIYITIYITVYLGVVGALVYIRSIVMQTEFARCGLHTKSKPLVGLQTTGRKTRRFQCQLINEIITSFAVPLKKYTLNIENETSQLKNIFITKL